MDDLLTRIAQGEPDALAEGLARADLLNAAMLTAPDDELRWNALNADLSIVAARAASSDLLEPVEIGVPIGAPDLVALVQLLEHLDIGLGRWALTRISRTTCARYASTCGTPWRSSRTGRDGVDVRRVPGRGTPPGPSCG